MARLISEADDFFQMYGCEASEITGDAATGYEIAGTESANSKAVALDYTNAMWYGKLDSGKWTKLLKMPTQ